MGRFEIILGRLKIVVGSLWVVPGFSNYVAISILCKSI